MIRTAKECTFMYPLEDANGEPYCMLKVSAIITETKFPQEDEEYDCVIKSIKSNDEELYKILDSLDATFKIKRLLNARAARLFRNSERVVSAIKDE